MDDAQVTVALCEILGAVPGWHWSPGAVPPPPGTALTVFYGDIPDSPDRAIGVRVYGGSDDSRVYQPQRQAQLRIRGRRNQPNDADEIAGIAFTVLQGRARTQGLSWIERQFFGPLGTDVNGREERADNYIIAIDNQGVSHE